MNNSEIKWISDDILGFVIKQKGIKMGLEALGRSVVSEIQTSISTPYPPSSKPGEPPHMRTGRLRSEVKWTLEETPEDFTLTIGVFPETPEDEKKALELEYGSSRMRPRPFIRRVLETIPQKVQEIFED